MKINRNNYEDILIQKLEGLLSTEQNAELDLFLHSNADIRTEWEAFGQTKLIPDESIVYMHKELLLKKQSTGVIPMYRTMLFIASIAASLLFGFFVSQKYLFNNTNQSAGGSSQLAVLNNQPPVNTVTPSKNNAIAAETNSSSNTVTPSKSLLASNYRPTNNIIQQASNNQQPTTSLLNDIQPMKTLSPKAMNYYPRVSYASFIWTKGLKTPKAPMRNVSEAGAWLQVASILGAEVMRLAGRGERVNKAPLELQLKKPLELNINNSYLRFHKLISFKKNNKNNK